MQVGQVTSAVDRRLVASAQEQAAVAELMEPSESLVGRPPLYLPQPVGELLEVLLTSPVEPVDDPDNE
ncbi:MAG: hypothetical protein M3460_14430 [Actinomycetota bacterium]|nr:hypothetical protein [Actinomycetota bacterium]